MPVLCSTAITVDKPDFFTDLKEKFVKTFTIPSPFEVVELSNENLFTFLLPVPSELRTFLQTPSTNEELQTEMGEDGVLHLNGVYITTSSGDWIVTNWGVESKTTNCVINFKEQWLSFSTPWRAPIRVMLEISKNYPTSTFRVASCESETESAEVNIISDGKIEDREIYQGKWWNLESEDDYTTHAELENFLTKNNLQIQGIGGW